MPSYQYIYVMNGLSKTFTGGREILKNINQETQKREKTSSTDHALMDVSLV